MATRSTITVRVNENERLTAYCHYDGYTENNGLILLEHYNSFERALALVKMGDMSCLGKDIEPNKDFEHSFRNRQAGVCFFYKRDRGEEDAIQPALSNEDEVEQQDFNYLFENGAWSVGGVALDLEMCIAE